MVICRGPMPFLPANKVAVGYVSPLTNVPHHSFVGGRAASALLSLGLDAVVLTNPLPVANEHYVKISGRLPDLEVEFRAGASLPRGQRAAFYYLLENELGGKTGSGSIFALGEGAYGGYLCANVAAEAIYHAGRGGAGSVFSRFASAIVLNGPESEGTPGSSAGPVSSSRYGEICERLAKYASRLSCRDAGTIIKLAATGKDPAGKNTLPAWNATRLGYPMSDIGTPEFLLATRDGRTGCVWCEVSCRHWHWVNAPYAPDGKDVFLDDFEPAYAVFAMLGLMPSADTFEAKRHWVREVDERIFLPIEQMGSDVIDIGLGISALFEAGEKGLIPASDLPSFLCDGSENFGSIEKAQKIIDLLRSCQEAFPAIRAVGDGPQALARLYPSLKDHVFTGGKNTLGNAGHCNRLWTFLMPFSRFFSHYSGQIYKIGGRLPKDKDDAEAHQLLSPVIREMFRREYFSILCNALSCCAFGFVVYSQNGEGEELDDENLLVEVLRAYGIETSREELMLFAQNFWAQSIDLKLRCGWQAPSAADFPKRIFEAVAQAVGKPAEECGCLMDLLIAEWKTQAKRVMQKYGYESPW